MQINPADERQRIQEVSPRSELLPRSTIRPQACDTPVAAQTIDGVERDAQSLGLDPYRYHVPKTGDVRLGEQRLRDVEIQEKLVQQGKFSRSAFESAALDLDTQYWSPEAQDKLMNRLDAIIGDPQELEGSRARDIAWAARRLRGLLPEDRQKYQKLESFFASRGFKLRPQSVVQDFGFYLERDNFSEKMRAFDRGGRLSSRDERAILGAVSKLADEGDIFHALWELRSRILDDGTLSAKSRNSLGRLEATLQRKVPGRVHRKEIKQHVESAQMKSFSAESLEALKRCVGRSKNDNGALHYARRLLEKAVASFREESTDPEIEVKSRIFERGFATFLKQDIKIDERFDAYAERQRLNTLLESGAIGHDEFRHRHFLSYTRESRDGIDAGMQQLIYRQAALEMRLLDFQLEILEETLDDEDERQRIETEDAQRRDELAAERHKNEERKNLAEQLAQQEAQVRDAERDSHSVDDAAETMTYVLKPNALNTMDDAQTNAMYGPAGRHEAVPKWDAVHVAKAVASSRRASASSAAEVAAAKSAEVSAFDAADDDDVQRGI